MAARPQTASRAEGGLRAVSPDLLARVGFALVCLGCVAGFFLFPTYPNYDTIYGLVWGREIVHGVLPSYDAYRTPTPHPLLNAVAVLLQPFGRQADRVTLALFVASFALLVAGTYRLARVLFTPLVGWIAAILVLTRLDFPFLAARGYIDIPYLALVVWAGALEADRPRRGGWVWVLLAGASLLRPEGVAFAIVYAIWMGWEAGWAKRLRYAACALAAPAIWALTDLVITGDPMWSFSYTRRSAELLDRRIALVDLPWDTAQHLSGLIKPPILVAAVIGIVLVARLAPRKLPIPGLIVLSGLGLYTLLSVLGLPSVSRYLIGTALGLLIFAAFAIGGFQVLPRGARARTLWAAGAVAIVAAGAGLALARLNPAYVKQDLATRERVRKNLVALFDRPGVRAGRHCGPVSVPNHKLIPDIRWVLGASRSQVVARSDPRERARARYGLAVFPTGRVIMENPAYGPFDQQRDDPMIQVPGPGFQRIAVAPQFTAYLRCRA